MTNITKQSTNNKRNNDPIYKYTSFKIKRKTLKDLKTYLAYLDEKKGLSQLVNEICDEWISSKLR